MAGFSVESTLLELGRSAEAPIGSSNGDQSLGISAVALEIGALVHDLLIPGESEPVQPFEDGPSRGLSAPRAVGVFDPEQEIAAEMTGVEPVEECGPGPADVQVAGRRRGEAQARARSAGN